jgi:hypothetical protein
MVLNKKNILFYSLVNLVVVLVILICIDFAAGSLLRKYYFSMKNGVQYRTTYSIEKTTADVIIFGSSRANHHYQPSAFENRLQLSYYNAGRDGEESTLYHFAVLKGMLKRYTPKIVVLDFLNGELGKTLYSYDRLSSLTPYYSTHPEMKDIIEMRSGAEKIKLLSKIYPYNSLMVSIATGNTNLNSSKVKDINGYLPIQSSKQITHPIEQADFTKGYELDSIKVNIFKAFIKTCKDAHIRLYIVASPYYVQFIGEDASMIAAKKIAADNEVEFIDLSHEKTFLGSPQLFGDSWHLNDDGATLFSNLLLDKLTAYNFLHPILR